MRISGNPGREGIPPPADYRKKVVNHGGDCPLNATFTREQVEKRIAFYRELNEKRETLKITPFIRKTFAVYGWEDTTTVRVYMRETISRIAAELFFSDYRINVRNVNPRGKDGKRDKDHGHVEFTVRATGSEIEALLEYIRPAASYYVYDPERSRYVPGNTEASEFIITRPEDTLQPRKFWRRSQSFISGIKEFR